MSAGLALEIAPAPSNTRQLVALALCAWHDADPVRCSKSKAQAAGRGEDSGKPTYSRRETDSLLLRLEREKEDALTGVEDDRNVVELVDYQRAHSHPMWARLAEGMVYLGKTNRFAHKLLIASFVRTSDTRTAICRAHALAIVSRPTGNSASEVMRSRLLDAVDTLAGRLHGVGFDNRFDGQADEWRRMLAVLAPTNSQSGKRMRGQWADENGKKHDHDEKALTLRAMFAKELVHWGWTRRQIGDLLDVSHVMVSRMVGPIQPEAMEPIWVDPESGRAYRDVTQRYLGHAMQK